MLHISFWLQKPLTSIPTNYNKFCVLTVVLRIEFHGYQLISFSQRLKRKIYNPFKLIPLNFLWFKSLLGGRKKCLKSNKARITLRHTIGWNSIFLAKILQFILSLMKFIFDNCFQCMFWEQSNETIHRSIPSIVYELELLFYGYFIT